MKNIKSLAVIILITIVTVAGFTACRQHGDKGECCKKESCEKTKCDKNCADSTSTCCSKDSKCKSGEQKSCCKKEEKMDCCKKDSVKH